MKKHIIFFAAIALFIMSFTPPQWELLGMRKVDFALDHDVIPVGAHEGGFTKLKLDVRGGALNMQKMVVHFMNGDDENIELKQNFPKGGGSRIIDLPGNKRIIKSISFHYDTKNSADSKATVRVFGRH